MKPMRTYFLIATTFLFSSLAMAGILPKEQSSQDLEKALRINQNYFSRLSTASETPRVRSGQPVVETDKFKYILMSGDAANSELAEMQRTFAQNLPSDMTLVLVTEKFNAASVERKFLQWLPRDRFIIASGSNLGDFTWGRDSYPYPVYKDDSKNVELIAYRYHRRFVGHKLIADSVGSKSMSSHDFVYVGGNLQATENGDCFIVDSVRAFQLPDSQFLNVFRCKTITRFPHIAGIGDIDEVIKVLPSKVILTNQASYKKTLEDMGYSVVMLPEVKNSYRTYANSVILNDTVFMPTYGGALDIEAQRVYENKGYRVIGIPSNSLSDNYRGSLHCLTMTYPEMDVKSLLGSLGMTQIH